MGPEEKYQFWLVDARYDLTTAEHMFATSRWFYVLSTCQQSIEKLAKGLVGMYLGFNSILFTHNIQTLIELIEDKIPAHIPKETREFFAELSKYAVNKRYPDYKQLISEKATLPEALRLFTLTKEAFAWLQTLKPSEPKPENTPPQLRP
ncbi:MAG: HEPN domain-containing protein [Deltaproteobacteria bacterium]|jgi:HEPN domain-containing protein|nr:HEPN domain-containing protein [Deltaproteobacteria bacterium]